MAQSEVKTFIANPTRYHPALVALHWLIMLMIGLNFLVIELRGEGGAGVQTMAGIPAIGIHMILGLTVLALLVVRVFIRLTEKQPATATTGNRLLDLIAQLTHWGL